MFRRIFWDGDDVLRKDKKKKICLASSSGGHYEQLLMLRPLLKKYDGFILTEKTAYSDRDKNIKTYFLKQVNRKEPLFPLYLFIDSAKSLYVFIKEKPDVVITTGVLGVIPMCMIAKAFGKKVIYIESFAKITDGTLSGKLLYKKADKFFVQWESMLEVYPDAEYLGGLY